MSLVSLNDVSLNLAGNWILDQVTWQIHARDRIALVGRNGAGKSTLLALLQGLIVQDKGQIHQQSGLRVAGLAQEVPQEPGKTVYQVLVEPLGVVGNVLLALEFASQQKDEARIAHCQQQLEQLNAWEVLPKIEMIASRLELDTRSAMDDLSGGMKRRVLLAAALIETPDLLLLDEPTNHLDMQAIEWLESYLKNYHGSVVVVTHDRQFLSQVATCIVEVDRGKLHTYACSWETFLERREARRLSEQKQNDLFDKRLSEEEAWIRQGIKARRTRNEGRVRALKSMREAYRQRRLQVGKVKSMTLDVPQASQIVLEAQQLNYTLEGRALLKDFSWLLTRGDKVGIIGPNGCGKTTLIRLLLGELTPDSGSVRRASTLSVAYFDQLRSQLDETKTVMANVADGAEHVTVAGKQKHVASYLRDFLFQPERFNQPVSSLSGGERNRLLLAKLLARPANVLVMDEPTNDLDIETLELLEQILIEYPGTLLLISHDREFINQVVSSVLVYEGEGQFIEHLGGYTDYAEHKKQLSREVNKAPEPVRRNREHKLNFNEQRELAQLPKAIEVLEAEIAAVQSSMSEPTFYQQDAHEIGRVNQDLKERECRLAELYARWEALEEKN